MKLSRRAFVRLGVWFAGIVSLAPGRLPAGSRRFAVPLGKVPDLANVGGFAVVKIKGKQILLARTGKQSVIAVDALCTHEQCVLFYDRKTGKISCGCHGSAFETSGAVRKGPARAALKSYAAAISADRIIVELGG